MGSGFITADPPGLTGASGDLSIQAHGELRGHERSPGPAMLDVELVESKGSIFMHTDHGFNAGRAQELYPGALHSLIRIRHRDHNPVHAGFDHRLRPTRPPRPSDSGWSCNRLDGPDRWRAPPSAGRHLDRNV